MKRRAVAAGRDQEVYDMNASDAEIEALIELMQADEDAALSRAGALVETYPEDARLHFLRGSMLIGAQRNIDAHGALSRAVSLAPDFAIARFQLGFFELTSGEPAAAIETWRPLAALPAGHYLRTFAEGLSYLIDDRFEEAVARLEDGIRANTDNLPLNRDMQLLIEACSPLIRAQDNEAEGAAAESATSVMLRQLTGRRR